MLDTAKQNTLSDDMLNLIRKYTNLPEENAAELSLTSKVSELGIDSIDLMEMIFELEEKHGIEIDESAAMEAQTVQDIINAV